MSTDGSGGSQHRPERVTIRGGAQPGAGPSTRSIPSPADLYANGAYAETLLRSLMRAQLGVALGVLLPAAAVVITFPILSVLLPSLVDVTVAGVPLTVAVLGVGIYPPLVVLAFLYVRRAARVEERFAALFEKP